MKKFLSSSTKVWLVLIVAALFLLACDVASVVSLGNKPSAEPTTVQGQSTAPGQPTKVTSSGAGPTTAPLAKDAESRISDSLNRLLMLDNKVLDSYHLEVSGTSPEWNKSQNKVESQAFTLSADVSADNVHFIKTTKMDKEKVTEAYIMNGTNKDGGKGYSVQGGAVKEDFFVQLGWVALPLDYGMPLIFASMGPTARGDEAIDGRLAEKWDVDLAKAPAGSEGILKGFGFGMLSSKGTVWVDKQTGALLKMNLDYESQVADAGKVVGKGSGRIELVVTKVGKVTVKLPDASNVKSTGPGATVPATTAAKGTPTRTPTAAPTPSAAKVGQRVVLNGVALTVISAQQFDTYGGKKADTGYKWVVATVTVENVSNAKMDVEHEQFDYLDKSGASVPGLLNGPSAPGTTGSTVFGFHSLAPGGKAEKKTLPIQLKKELVPGLQLLFIVDDDNSIKVNLGFATGVAG